MASKLDNHYEMILERRRSGLSFASIAAELDRLGVTTEKTSIREYVLRRARRVAQINTTLDKIGQNPSTEATPAVGQVRPPPARAAPTVSVPMPSELDLSSMFPGVTSNFTNTQLKAELDAKKSQPSKHFSKPPDQDNK